MEEKQVMRLSDDENRLLSLLGNEELTLEQIVQAAKRLELCPSISFHGLIKSALEKGVIVGRRDGYTFFYSSNIGNCKNIAEEDYRKWIGCWRNK